ncbi:MAG: SRPBCC family protein [Oligoflexales bacterium]|nr:SRPBCC family protein [Oligoflexales bacterium]
MFAKIIGVLIILLAVLASLARMQPDHFTISRSIIIKGTANEVFSQVENFHNWDKWSPWAKLDPTMEKIFEGSPSGEGAIYKWKGDKSVGEGRMTIIKSQAPEHIRIELEFLKPMAAINATEFTFKPENQVTTVTWTMSGKNNFLSKVIYLFFSLEKMIGPDFEKGLFQLKAAVENKI